MKVLFEVSKPNRFLTFVLTVAVGLGFNAAARADVTLSIASAPNAGVDFVGSGLGAAAQSTFDFVPNGSGQEFQVTLSSDSGPSVGLFGTISDSFVYTEGSITSIPLGGGLVFQSAPVSTVGGGPATLTITDASSVSLTASITMTDISTQGTGGTINVIGDVNVSNATYSGTNSDLKALATDINQNGAVAAITFQFTVPTTLASLTSAGSVHDTSYSGAITAAGTEGSTSVPEPATLSLFCIALSMLALRTGWRRACQS